MHDPRVKRLQVKVTVMKCAAVMDVQVAITALRFLFPNTFVLTGHMECTITVSVLQLLFQLVAA